jgi:rhamnogalacturonyl hydrolase YesR
MEALIRELKEQAKDHIKLGDDYNVAFGRGMGKALYAIAKELEKLDKKEKRKDECEPLSLISKIILTNALKDSEKRAKKIHKKTLNETYVMV